MTIQREELEEAVGKGVRNEMAGLLNRFGIQERRLPGNPRGFRVSAPLAEERGVDAALHDESRDYGIVGGIVGTVWLAFKTVKGKLFKPPGYDFVTSVVRVMSDVRERDDTIRSLSTASKETSMGICSSRSEHDIDLDVTTPPEVGDDETAFAASARQLGCPPIKMSSRPQQLRS